ncbi:MAG: hypothetical protein LUD81_03170 [Clostridiales bacterium]|nr:hypothetical protein [Clostridiales bacterium]
MENTGYYRYYLDDDNYIQSTVRLEGVVENIAQITYGDEVTVIVYKDGEALAFYSGDYIYGDGKYTVVIKNGDDIGRINFIF